MDYSIRTRCFIEKPIPLIAWRTTPDPSLAREIGAVQANGISGWVRTLQVKKQLLILPRTPNLHFLDSICTFRKGQLLKEI